MASATPPSAPIESSSRDRRTAIVCAGAWLVGLVVAVLYVLHFAQRFPFADDWYMSVPVLAHRQPLTLAWLWSQHNEHRIFIPRLAFVLLGRVDGGDFRAPVLLNVAALAASAAALMWAARHRRGSSSPSDVFFVFMLLHVLQSSVMWGAQFQFVSSTLFFSAIVFVVVMNEHLDAARLSLVVLATLALPLCGGNGLVLVPPIAAWLFGLGCVRLTRSDRSARGAGLVAVLGALLAGALVAFYLVGWHATPHPWPKPTLLASAAVALHFVAAGLGPNFAIVWPLGGILVGGLLVATAIVLAAAAMRSGASPGPGGQGRSRALALLALTGSLVCLALSIGYGRGGRGWEPYLEYHYAPLALPMLCVVYLTSFEYRAASFGRALRWLLCAMTAAVYFDALPRSGRDAHVDAMNAFAADLATGASAHDLVARHMHLLAGNDTPDERINIERNLDGLFTSGYYGRGAK